MLKTFLSRGLMPALCWSWLSVAGAQPLVSLNYENAELSAVAAEVAERTGYQLVLDPRLSGRANIISPPGMALTPDQVWEVFIATLQVNNFNAVPAGDRVFKIVPTEQSVRDSNPVGGDNTGATVTRFIPLQYVGVRNAASSLRGIVGQQGLLVPVTESNALIVVDSGRNVERVMEVIRQIDVDRTIFRAVQLENANAEEVAETLRRIATDQRGEGEPVTIRTEILANTATNQVLLRGPAETLTRLRSIIAELDQAGRMRGSFDAIYLNHADGEELVPIITQLITGQASGGQGGGGQQPAAAVGGGAPIVTFHRPTNAVLVNGPPEAQRAIRSIVSQLDIRRPQVLIEAIVVEIANNTARELGVQYLSGGDGVPVTAATFTDTQPNLLSAAGAAFFLTEDDGTRDVSTTIDGVTTITEEDDVDADVAAISGQLVTAAVSDLLSFNGFLAGFGDVTDDGTVYGVLLSAIKSDSRSNVLSTPFTTVLDNETARLSVGQEISIVTGEAVGTDFQGGFRNIERQEVGTILDVVPQINDGDAVTLKIKLEVSSLTAFVSTSDTPIIQKSTTESVLTVDNGQTVILGGLVDNDQRNTESKVPFLGDIPLLGFLFRGQTKSEEETTLMVFIRPTIIRDAATADAVTSRKYDFATQRQLQAERRREGPSRLDRISDELIGMPTDVLEEPSGNE